MVESDIFYFFQKDEQNRLRHSVSVFLAFLEAERITPAPNLPPAPSLPDEKANPLRTCLPLRRCQTKKQRLSQPSFFSSAGVAVTPSLLTLSLGTASAEKKTKISSLLLLDSSSGRANTDHSSLYLDRKVTFMASMLKALVCKWTVGLVCYQPVLMRKTGKRLKISFYYPLNLHAPFSREQVHFTILFYSV